MKTRGLLVLLVLFVPGGAFASCESGLVLNARDIDFAYYDAIPMSVEDFPPDAQSRHFRGLAHALAVAQACFDSTRMHSCEAATPARSKVWLLPGGDLVAADTTDVSANDLARTCARADSDSVCVLWTCEIGRFRTEKGARELADGLSIASDPEVFKDGWVRSRDATILYDSCSGSWEPWSFVVRLSGGVAPWATRTGLFFTRADAEREAARWYDAFGRRPRVVRQRVDGALLEQALRQPMDGC